MSTALVKHTLLQCRKKLEIYRDHSSGEYHGGIEHTALIDMIDSTLAVLDEGMGFADFVATSKEWLKQYPPDIFNGSSGDSGPLFVVAIRKAVKSLGKQP